MADSTSSHSPVLHISNLSLEDSDQVPSQNGNFTSLSLDNNQKAVLDQSSSSIPLLQNIFVASPAIDTRHFSFDNDPTSSTELQPSLPIVRHSSVKNQSSSPYNSLNNQLPFDNSLKNGDIPISNPSTPLSIAPPAPLSETSQYSKNTLSANGSPVMSYSLEDCSFNELKAILSEKLIQLSQVQNQNAQLWTLVNKQRTMIFDLQRDFDNAVEQNEKLAKQLEPMKSTNSSQQHSQAPSPSLSLSSTSSINNNTQNLSSQSLSTPFVTLSIPQSTILTRKPSRRDVPPASATIPMHTSESTSTPILSSHKSDPVMSNHRSASYRKPVLSKTSADTSNSVKSPQSLKRYSNGSMSSARSDYKPLETCEPSSKKNPENPYDQTSSDYERAVKRRPPPIHLPDDLDPEHDKSSALTISATPSTPVISILNSNFSKLSTSEFSNPRSAESEKSKIASPRHSDSFQRQATVLYVEPEGLSSISLDISTLIGKVKSVYRPRREDPIAIINALDRETRKELWKVIKDYTSLQNFDNSIRPIIHNLPRLPDKALFQSHAPSRVDSRKISLEEYFNAILSRDLPVIAAQLICEFLSTDTIDPMDIPDTPSRCEGYLTKRGKKIRSWRVKYFMIEKDRLNFYDKPGGELQGTISLKDAKLGRQIKNDTDSISEESMEKTFRHAFLLLEQRKKDYIRHVLCAESDSDRDHWIDALLEVISEYSTTIHTSHQISTSNLSLDENLSPKRKAGPFEDNSRLANIPPPFISQRGNSPVTPTASLSSRSRSEPHSFHDLKPTGSANTSYSFSNDTVDLEDNDASKENKKFKKKSFFSFRNKSNANPAMPNSGIESFNTGFQSTPYSAVEQQPMPIRPSEHHAHTTLLSTPQTPLSPTYRSDKSALNMTLDEAVASQQEIAISDDKTEVIKDVTSRRIFGIPLADAVNLSYKDVHHCRVPSIVYRCIELLKIREAILEEGIFRLSGSSATIRALKERFNNEYDIDLVNSDTYYDIHAVAGLLKLYLREVPTLILSSYLAPEFRDAVEITDVTTKILKLKSLVLELPRENRDLLCVLCSLLTEVIAHQNINKMNLRNVGIVFALTLNISSSVLTSFLTDFDSIFGDAAPDETRARAVIDFPKIDL